MSRILDILEFINESDVISTFELVDKFGYTSSGARGMLDKLKKRGLAINDQKGEWVLTDRGIDKLIYHKRWR